MKKIKKALVFLMLLCTSTFFAGCDLFVSTNYEVTAEIWEQELGSLENSTNWQTDSTTLGAQEVVKVRDNIAQMTNSAEPNTKRYIEFGTPSWLYVQTNTQTTKTEYTYGTQKELSKSYLLDLISIADNFTDAVFDAETNTYKLVDHTEVLDGQTYVYDFLVQFENEELVSATAVIDGENTTIVYSIGETKKITLPEIKQEDPENPDTVVGSNVTQSVWQTQINDLYNANNWTGSVSANGSTQNVAVRDNKAKFQVSYGANTMTQYYEFGNTSYIYTIMGNETTANKSQYNGTLQDFNEMYFLDYKLLADNFSDAVFDSKTGSYTLLNHPETYMGQTITANYTLVFKDGKIKQLISTVNDQSLNGVATYLFGETEQITLPHVEGDEDPVTPEDNKGDLTESVWKDALADIKNTRNLQQISQFVYNDRTDINTYELFNNITKHSFYDDTPIYTYFGEKILQYYEDIPGKYVTADVTSSHLGLQATLNGMFNDIENNLKDLFDSITYNVDNHIYTIANAQLPNQSGDLVDAQVSFVIENEEIQALIYECYNETFARTEIYSYVFGAVEEIVLPKVDSEEEPVDPPVEDKGPISQTQWQSAFMATLNNYCLVEDRQSEVANSIFYNGKMKYELDGEITYIQIEDDIVWTYTQLPESQDYTKVNLTQMAGVSVLAYNAPFYFLANSYDKAVYSSATGKYTVTNFTLTEGDSLIEGDFEILFQDNQISTITGEWEKTVDGLCIGSAITLTVGTAIDFELPTVEENEPVTPPEEGGETITASTWTSAVEDLLNTTNMDCSATAVGMTLMTMSLYGDILKETSMGTTSYTHFADQTVWGYQQNESGSWQKVDITAECSSKDQAIAEIFGNLVMAIKNAHAQAQYSAQTKLYTLSNVEFDDTVADISIQFTDGEISYLLVTNEEKDGSTTIVTNTAFTFGTATEITLPEIDGEENPVDPPVDESTLSVDESTWIESFENLTATENFVYNFQITGQGQVSINKYGNLVKSNMYGYIEYLDYSNEKGLYYTLANGKYVVVEQTATLEEVLLDYVGPIINLASAYNSLVEQENTTFTLTNYTCGDTEGAMVGDFTIRFEDGKLVSVVANNLVVESGDLTYNVSLQYNVGVAENVVLPEIDGEENPVDPPVDDGDENDTPVQEETTVTNEQWVSALTALTNSNNFIVDLQYIVDGIYQEPSILKVYNNIIYAQETYDNITHGAYIEFENDKVWNYSIQDGEMYKTDISQYTTSKAEVLTEYLMYVLALVDQYQNAKYDDVNRAYNIVNLQLNLDGENALINGMFAFNDGQVKSITLNYSGEGQVDIDGEIVPITINMTLESGTCPEITLPYVDEDHIIIPSTEEEDKPITPPSDVVEGEKEVTAEIWAEQLNNLVNITNYTANAVVTVNGMEMSSSVVCYGNIMQQINNGGIAYLEFNEGVTYMYVPDGEGNYSKYDASQMFPSQEYYNAQSFAMFQEMSTLFAEAKFDDSKCVYVISNYSCEATANSPAIQNGYFEFEFADGQLVKLYASYTQLNVSSDGTTNLVPGTATMWLGNATEITLPEVKTETEDNGTQNGVDNTQNDQNNEQDSSNSQGEVIENTEEQEDSAQDEQIKIQLG